MSEDIYFYEKEAIEILENTAIAYQAKQLDENLSRKIKDAHKIKM